MTVTAQTPIISATAAAAATVFPYPFKIFEGTDLLVTVDNVVKTITTHYTVSGAGDDAGGNVTFLVAMAGGEVVVLRRALPVIRDTNYQEGGDLLANTHNDDHDYPIMLIQQQEVDIQSALRFPDLTGAATLLPVAATRASKYQAYDVAGNPVLLAGTTSSATDAALVSFIANFTGAVIRSALEKMRDHVTAKDAGTATDGVTEAAAALRTVIASIKSIDAGGVENTYLVSTALGLLQAGQSVFGRGAKLTTDANITIVNHEDDSSIEGMVFVGSGKASAKTSQIGVSIDGNVSFVGPTRTRTVNCTFRDIGGAGYHVDDVVENHQGNLLLGGIFQSCNIGIDIAERGEYTQAIGGSVTLCNTGVRIIGGNSNLGGMTISDNGVGILVDAGGNDAHGQVWGFSCNHNTTANIQVNATNFKSFAFSAGSIYAGTVHLNGCSDVRFNAVDFGDTVTLKASAGTRNTVAQACHFTALPTLNVNADSEFLIIDPVLPGSTSVESSFRINGAVSRVSQTGPAPTIATATLHTYGFNLVDINAITANAAYSVAQLYDTTNKYWDFTVLKTPKASFFVEICANLTVAKLGGAFDDTTVDVYLIDHVYGDRLATFTKTIDMVDGSDHFRIYSFMGKVPKGSGKIGIRIRNDTGGNITVFNNTAAKPSYGQAGGW